MNNKLASDTQDAAPAAPEASQSELLDAIEGLLITFVYENPLPPDLEATTRDAHIAVAEELLIHHGRTLFVQSRVDRKPDAEIERLREALRDAQTVIEDMRSENKLHGHITNASALYLHKVKPRIDAALQREGKG